MEKSKDIGDLPEPVSSPNFSVYKVEKEKWWALPQVKKAGAITRPSVSGKIDWLIDNTEAVREDAEELSDGWKNLGKRLKIECRKGR